MRQKCYMHHFLITSETLLDLLSSDVLYLARIRFLSDFIVPFFVCSDYRNISFYHFTNIRSKTVGGEDLTKISILGNKMCVSGGKKYSFFRKFDVLCFLETPVLRFALLPYYRRSKYEKMSNFNVVIYIFELRFTKKSTF